MKISKAVNHGVECWVLNFKEDGKYRRRFFETKIAAEREMEALGLERRNFGTAFGAMTSAQRIEWGALDARLPVAGVTMTAVVDFFFQHKPAAVPVPIRHQAAEVNPNLVFRRIPLAFDVWCLSLLPTD